MTPVDFEIEHLRVGVVVYVARKRGWSCWEARVGEWLRGGASLSAALGRIRQEQSGWRMVLVWLREKARYFGL